jgi:hypothetical protein
MFDELGMRDVLHPPKEEVNANAATAGAKAAVGVPNGGGGTAGGGAARAGEASAETGDLNSLDLLLAAAKFNPNHDELGRFSDGGGGGTMLDQSGEAQGMRDRLTTWLEAKTARPNVASPVSIADYAPGHAPVPFEQAGSEARAVLKQEIVEALGDRPGLAAAMSKELPYRLTANPSEYQATIKLTGRAADTEIDRHESDAMLRQQGIAINGKFAAYQGHAFDDAQRVALSGGQLGVDMVMKPAEIQQFNARVFTDANLDAWHGTSSDGDARSHALQQAAVNAFGLKGADMGWKTAPVSGKVSGPTADKFRTEQSILMRAHPQAQFDTFIKETYAHTQAELVKAGVTGTVMLYRGMSWRTLAEVPRELRPLLRNGPAGELRDKVTDAPVQVERPGTYRVPQQMRVQTQMNPLSSWSVGFYPALSFAMGNGDRYHVILKAVVPVERIVATARTGMGALTEGEVIIRGGNIDAVATKTNSQGRS